MTTKGKALDYGLPEGVELVDIDGGKRRARFRIQNPLDPSEFILLESLPDKTTQDGRDPYDVTVKAEVASG